MKKLLLLLMPIVCVLNAGQLHITQEVCTNSFLTCKNYQHLSNVEPITRSHEQEFMCYAQKMYDLGVAHDLKGEHEQALSYYRQAASDEYCSIAKEVACNNMGAIFAEHGDYQRALEYYIRAGKAGIVYYNMGLSHYMLGNDSQAIYFLSQAEQEFPDRSVLTCLAACYYRTGEYEEATRYLLRLYIQYHDPEDAYQMGIIAWQRHSMKAASYWFGRAASAGHQEAQKYLTKHFKT